MYELLRDRARWCLITAVLKFKVLLPQSCSVITENYVVILIVCSGLKRQTPPSKRPDILKASQLKFTFESGL
jgi:hypothetical protein